MCKQNKAGEINTACQLRACGAKVFQANANMCVQCTVYSGNVLNKQYVYRNLVNTTKTFRATKRKQTKRHG